MSAIVDSFSGDHKGSVKETLNLALILGIGILGIYAISKIKTFTKPGVDALSTGIADVIIWWDQLGSGAPIQVSGNVVLPDGSVAAISSLTWKSDNQGNAYTKIGNAVYELAPRDANDNFTLTQVA